MGIYSQARKMALGAVCASSVVLGIGMAAAPGSALAACTDITGSGSSLQEAQQNTWTGLNPVAPCTVTYTATSSGKGLAEFGVGTKVLNKNEAGNAGKDLDAFVGTDDPPTGATFATDQLKEMEEASGSVAWTTPIVAAPVAVILHPPTECEVQGTAFKIPNAVLSLVWHDAGLLWKHFLWLIGASFIEKTTNACEVKIKREVRSDSSGTSFAFKQYLCQIDGVTWGNGAGQCESGEDFVSDAESWPAGTEAEITHKGGTEENKGSGGEAAAVKEEAGSIGYVNLANAVSAGFKSFAESKTLFWGEVEEGISGTDFAEPVKNVTEGNCPTSYEFPAGVETEAKEGMWAKVHLAKVGQEEAYPLCTLTYDVAWQNYETSELEKEYGGKTKAKEIGEGTKQYLKYTVEESKGQKEIANYYSPLPENVQKISSEIVTKHVG